MKKLLSLLALALLAFGLYLAFYPVNLNPVAWQAPPAAAIVAANPAIKDVQRLARGVGIGPEGIAVDAVGRVYAGYEDGRIVSITPNGTSFTEMANSRGGRPLGITFGPNGGLMVADAEKGLLAVGSSETPKSLLTEVDKQRLILTDDVDNTRLDKNVYFTDASDRPVKESLLSILEHSGKGRLMEYNVANRTTRVLLNNLQFANGVAVGPDDAYVLVNETGAYRITRYWLKGPKTGTSDVFIDNLPGLPDNLSYDYDNNLFWVALYSARSSQLDELLAGPTWKKKVAARLPKFLQPYPPKIAWVLGISAEGKVVHNLRYEGADAYGPITSVEAYGPWLYLGSLTADSIARLPLNKVLPNAPAPPAGWENTPERPAQFTPPVNAEAVREQKEEEEREQAKAAGKPLPPESEEEREREEHEREEREGKK